ncbi:inositol monophosphatase family protein [Parachitinimonas caeni]|uniref:Inositol monophosphatase family protein n=1 Tax=Parachitinimonas caeni TaxID=3031301 RepID=A0ABT7E0S0_9NEIS|nr:inositol monophosphatase family protein [Parachitinimonas caeni]MDK2125020.1 inositol monophosphatase family protein [Parachitinimonas caeni]
MTAESLLDQVIAAVREVAQTEVMPRFLRVGSSRKDDGTLFTEADVQTQRALTELLPKIVPVPVLGEEMSEEEQETLWANHQDGLWVVDPIDGTTNFVHGLPYFAISVALMRQGRPVLGVIYNPVADEVFCAEVGEGAHMNGLRLPLKKHVPAMPDAIAGVEVKWLGGRLPMRLASVAPFGSQRNLGASTLDWCYLAAGRFDLYIHGGQRLWDYAAGSLILLEAGGAIAGLFQDDYWSDHVWKRSVVAASNPVLFEQWRKWVRCNT